MPKATARDVALCGLLVLLATALFVWADSDIDWDDAYISYRYARNIVAGLGPVYNPGERIYGSTTLTWTFWLAGWSWATGIAVPVVGQLTSAFLFSANAVLFYSLLRFAGAPSLGALLAGLLLLAAPRYLMIAATGMETMFYVALILLAAHAVQRRAWFIAGMLGGLVLATRLDGLAFVGALGLAAIYDAFSDASGRVATIAAGPRSSRSKHAASILVRGAAGFLLTFGPFLIFCAAYYGSVIPNTFTGKRLHPMDAGRWWILDHFWSGPGKWALAAGMISLGCVVAIRLWRQQKLARWNAPAGQVESGPVRALFVIWLALYLSAWAIARIDSYSWYIAAMAPATAFLVVGILLARNMSERSRLLISAPLASVVLLVWSFQAYEDIRWFHTYAAQIERPRKELAQLVNDALADPGASIGTGAIGLIGWHCPTARIVDFAGLTTTQEMLRIPEAQRPTLLFVDEVADNVREHYQFVAELVAPVSGQLPRRAWLRRDAAHTWDVQRAQAYAAAHPEAGRFILSAPNAPQAK